MVEARSTFLVALVLTGIVIPVARANPQLASVVRESAFIGVVHVDRIDKGPPRFGQQATLVVREAWRGTRVERMVALAREESFSSIDLAFVPGADQVVFLRKQRVGNEDAWVLAEGFRILASGRVVPGEGSSTWWVLEGKSLAQVKEGVMQAVAKDDADKVRQATHPDPPPRPRPPRKDPGD